MALSYGEVNSIVGLILSEVCFLLDLKISLLTEQLSPIRNSSHRLKFHCKRQDYYFALMI